MADEVEGNGQGTNGRSWYENYTVLHFSVMLGYTVLYSDDDVILQTKLGYNYSWKNCWSHTKLAQSSELQDE